MRSRKSLILRFAPVLTITCSLSVGLGVAVTKTIENHITRPFLVFEPRSIDPLTQAVDSLFMAMQAHPVAAARDTVLQLIELPPERRVYWDTLHVLDRRTILDTMTVVRHLDVLDTTTVTQSHGTPWRKDDRRP